MSPQDSLEELMAVTLDTLRLMRRNALCHKEETKVNFVQVHALMLVSEQPGMTMKEFARALRITSPSATSFVNRLVKAGWVSRATDPDNRKLVRLQLTPSGKTILNVHMRRKKDDLRNLLSLLPPDDHRHLLRILGHLSKTLRSEPR